MAGRTNVAVGQMLGWTNVGRTNVGRTNVGRTKVAPPFPQMVDVVVTDEQVPASINAFTVEAY